MNVGDYQFNQIFTTADVERNFNQIQNTLDQWDTLVKNNELSKKFNVNIFNETKKGLINLKEKVEKEFQNKLNPTDLYDNSFWIYNIEYDAEINYLSKKNQDLENLKDKFQQKIIQSEKELLKEKELPSAEAEGLLKSINRREQIELIALSYLMNEEFNNSKVKETIQSLTHQLQKQGEPLLQQQKKAIEAMFDINYKDYGDFLEGPIIEQQIQKGYSLLKELNKERIEEKPSFVREIMDSILKIVPQAEETLFELERSMNQELGRLDEQEGVKKGGFKKERKDLQHSRSWLTKTNDEMDKLKQDIEYKLDSSLLALFELYSQRVKEGSPREENYFILEEQQQMLSSYIKNKFFRKEFREGLIIAKDELEKVMHRLYPHHHPLKDFSFEFEIANPNEVLELQKKLINSNEKYEILNLNTLSSDLLPTHKMKIDNAVYYCSKPFKMAGRPFVLGLVEINDQVFPRLFYLSGSQGAWRVVPGITKEGVDKGHLAKGYFEVDIQLPISLTFALNKLYTSEKANIGTLSPLPRATDLLKSTDSNLTASYANETFLLDFAKKTKKAKNLTAIERASNKPDPKTIGLDNPKLYPNFSHLVKEEKFSLPHYGEVTGKVYPSIDNTRLYFFCEARDGKAFLAAEERIVDNPITKFGNHQINDDLNSMDNPLLEHFLQVEDRFAPKTPSLDLFYEKESLFYLPNWNFVRQLPIIQMYYQAQGRKVPPEV